MSKANQKSCVFLGYGYTAKHIAMAMDKESFDIYTTNRASSTNSIGTSLAFDYPSIIPAIDWSEITHLIISIPPKNGEDFVISAFKEQILSAPKLEYIGLLSSTGVYGNYNGDYVTEEAPLKAAPNTSGYNRILAERLWQNLTSKRPDIILNIFRLSGIYGHNRSILDGILSKEYILSKPDHFFSRIHVEDIAQVVVKAMELKLPGKIFNLADDYPSAPEEPYLFAYNLINKPSPPLVNYQQLPISPMMKEFLNNNKRINNDKMKDLLGIKLKYASFKEGLTSILEQSAYDQK